MTGVGAGMVLLEVVAGSGVEGCIVEEVVYKLVGLAW